ncbi:MAG: Uma2 family endonuclease [Nannocystaceae bacterium]
MEAAARRIATYEDLLAVPSGQVAELLYGVLHTHPRPAPPHARAAGRLTMKLGRSFDEGDDGPGGWWILPEPEVHLPGGHVLVPDLAGWREERMPALPSTAYFELSPDWVCEVLSPSTEAVDRADKLPIYAEGGVGHVWLVDPVLGTLEVLRREGAQWLLVGTFKGQARVRAEPFDAVELDLGALWRGPAKAKR